MNNSHQLRVLKARWTFVKNYSYVIIDHATKEAAVIDPAWDMGAVSSAIIESSAKLTSILLTHSHFDHVNLVDSLVKRFNSQVYMSCQEIDYYNFRCKNLNPVQDLETIELGQTLILCLLTPGHTIGGTSYLLSGSLFTGDTIFIEGCGICNTQGGSAESMFHTIQKIKKVVDPSVRIYPGHCYGKSPGYTLSYLMKENIYFLIDQKEMFVDLRMREGQRNLFNFH